MKYVYILLAICLFTAMACKKDAGPTITVTVTEKVSWGIDSAYAAIVDNPDPSIHKFLCTLGASEPKPFYNCTNAVYIRNLPASLAVAGKRVTFQKYKDDGQPLLYSSINHAHVLTVSNPQEAR